MAQTQSNDPLIWLAESGYSMIEGLAGIEASDLRQVQSLKGIEDWQKQLLLEQLKLRKRSRKRFPDASQWIWSDRSLAQASDWATADFKAQLIPSNVTAVDACCGAGVDLIAMCRRQSKDCDTTMVGLDLDPQMIAVAKRNCAFHGFAPSLRCEEFSAEAALKLSSELRDCNERLWLHIDPDRRPTTRGGQRKTLQAEEFMPPLGEIEGACQTFDGAIIKVAPSTQFEDSQIEWLAETAVRLWVGVDGETKQQLLFLGDARQQICELLTNESLLRQDLNLRSAAVLIRQMKGSLANTTQTRLTYYVGDQEESFAGRCEEVGEYVFDLHSALHSSHLAESWAADNSLHALSDHAGFYTGIKPIRTEWAQSFRVIETLAWDDRKVRKLLRKLDGGVVEVKNRLVKLDANAAQKRYSRGDGNRPLVLLVTKLGQRVRCIVAERC